MADLELPDFIRPESMSIKLKSNTKTNRSPWTGAVQTVGFGGSHWAIEMQLGSLTDWESRQLEAILYQLDGMAGVSGLATTGGKAPCLRVRLSCSALGSPALHCKPQDGHRAKRCLSAVHICKLATS